MAEDALNPDRMNVGSGGKLSHVKDTTWEGQLQKLVDDQVVPKGMKKVLEERGVDTTGLRASDLRKK